MRTAGAIVLERSQLGRLIEANLLDQPRALDDARICSEHAVDIRPDLDRLGAERGTKQRCAVIAAATTEGRDDAASRRAHEPAHDRRDA